MQLDMRAAYRTFREYVAAYDPSDPKISLKISHILRVAKKSRELARRLKLSDDDVSLAELIGLLHDIGRFEQVARYDTFKDSDGADHAVMGCQVLFGDDGNIRDFISDDRYDEIIYASVLNHNKVEITSPESLSNRELLHAKIIRDTDKLDIFRVQIEDSKSAIFEHDDIVDDILTPAIYEDFLKEKLVDYSLRSGSAPDGMICTLGYVYDINFSPTYDMIISDGWLERFQDLSFSDAYTHDRFSDACRRAIEHCLKMRSDMETSGHDA